MKQLFAKHRIISLIVAAVILFDVIPMSAAAQGDIGPNDFDPGSGTAVDIGASEPATSGMTATSLSLGIEPAGYVQAVTTSTANVIYSMADDDIGKLVTTGENTGLKKNSGSEGGAVTLENVGGAISLTGRTNGSGIDIKKSVFTEGDDTPYTITVTGRLSAADKVILLGNLSGATNNYPWLASKDVGTGGSFELTVTMSINEILGGSGTFNKLTIQTQGSVDFFIDSVVITVPSSDTTPTATAVNANASAPVVGTQLTGTYVYNAGTGTGAGGESGSTFKWYRGDTATWATASPQAIPGADAKTYTPTGADVGKYLYFEVTPNGTLMGTAARSDASGQVGIMVSLTVIQNNTTGTAAIDGGTSAVKVVSTISPVLSATLGNAASVAWTATAGAFTDASAASPVYALPIMNASLKAPITITATFEATSDGPDVDSTSLDITTGQTGTFTVSLGQSGNAADIATITSDDTSVATVDKSYTDTDGDTVTVTGVSAGTATIEVAFSGGTATPTSLYVAVSVTDDPAPVTDHTITATAGTGGSISPSGNVQVADGVDKTFYITANNGYYISNVNVDGVNQGAIGSYTFINITGNHTIHAEFAQIYMPSPSRGSDSDSGSSYTPPAVTIRSTLVVDAAKAKATTLAGKARIRHNGEIKVLPEAWQAFGNVPVDFDTVDGNGVQVRVTVREPGKMTGEKLLSGYVKGSIVDSRKALFEKWFKNKIQAIHFDQQGDFGQPVEIAAKLDLTGMDNANLCFYSYDKKTNTYRRIEKPAYWIDKNGFLHFTTELAGDIVVSEGPLMPKGQDTK